MTELGMLGTRRRMSVDTGGVLTFPGMRGSMRVWIGAEDGWHDPAQQPSTRQQRLGALSGVETRARVTNADVVIRAYGAYERPDAFAVEIANETTAAVVVAIAVEDFGASWGEIGIFDGNTVLVPRAPADHLQAADIDALWTGVQSAPPVTGAPSAAPSGRVAAATGPQAFVYPLPHGATLRVAVCLDPGTLPAGAPDSLPTLDQVRAGWDAQLLRGMRTVLPDARLQAIVDASRVELLLWHETHAPGPDSMVALEDWGFDDEARREFEHLGFLNRRRVTNRPVDAAPWSHIEHTLRAVTSTLTFPQGPAELLNHVRSLLAFERPDRTIDLLTYLPPDWFGQPVEVIGAPTRGGLVSYALRWHGSRPALLWECEHPGLRLRAPGLDGLWATDEQQGEALLGPVAL